MTHVGSGQYVGVVPMESSSAPKVPESSKISWWERLKRSRNLGSLLAAQGLGLASGLLFAMATARKLSPADFGRFAVWQALLGYLTVCTEFGTAHVGARRVASGDEAQAAFLYKTVIAVRFGGLIGGLALVAALFLEKTSGNSCLYWLVGFGCIGLILVFNFEWLHLGQHREPVVARARVGRHLVLLIAALIILQIGLDIHTVIALYVCAAALQSGLAFVGKPRPAAVLRWDGVVDVVRECWPLMVALLAQQWVWSGGLISAAKHELSADFDGLAIGYRCYAVGVALFGAYAAYLLPRSAKRMAESQHAFRTWIRASQRDATIVTVVLLLGAPLTAWLIVPVAFGHRYTNAPIASCLYILALIPLLWRITSSNAIVALGKTQSYCFVSLTGAFTAVLVMLLAPTKAVLSPIFASAAGETVFALGAHWTLSRLMAKLESHG